MSRPRNWKNAGDRDRIARHGADNIHDMGLPVEFRSLPKKRKSKAAIREDAAAAIASVTRIVRCGGCGHSASITLPPVRLGARLRCTKCGEIAK